MGNAKAKRLYEAFLPKCFQRPETDQSAEIFIRDKYDKKKYMDKVIDVQMLRVSPRPPSNAEVSGACLRRPVCFSAERKELRQHSQGASCVREDETGESTSYETAARAELDKGTVSFQGRIESNRVALMRVRI